MGPFDKQERKVVAILVGMAGFLSGALVAAVMLSLIL